MYVNTNFRQRVVKYSEKMAGMRAFKVAKCPEAHAKTNRAVVNQKECVIYDCVSTSVLNPKQQM
jgi:hypothetical protein